MTYCPKMDHGEFTRKVNFLSTGIDRSTHMWATCSPFPAHQKGHKLGLMDFRPTPSDQLLVSCGIWFMFVLGIILMTPWRSFRPLKERSFTQLGSEKPLRQIMVFPSWPRMLDVQNPRMKCLQWIETHHKKMRARNLPKHCGYLDQPLMSTLVLIFCCKWGTILTSNASVIFAGYLRSGILYIWWKLGSWGYLVRGGQPSQNRGYPISWPFRVGM